MVIYETCFVKTLIESVRSRGDESGGFND